MAWNQPKTWNVNEILTAENFNQQIRDNLSYLKPARIFKTYASSAAVHTGASFDRIYTANDDIQITPTSDAVAVVGIGTITLTPNNALDIGVNGIQFLHFYNDTSNGSISVNASFFGVLPVTPDVVTTFSLQGRHGTGATILAGYTFGVMELP